MKAGPLRHRVTIVQLITTRTDSGAAEPSWLNFAVNRPAEVKELSGREYWQAQQVAAETSVRVRMRYLAGVLPTMRVTFEGRTLEILSVINPDGRKVEHQLMCREIT